MESFEAVRVKYVDIPDGYTGYMISTAEKNSAIRARGAAFIEQHRGLIDELAEEFGN